MRESTWVDLVEAAIRRSVTISTAESCTGGAISSILTDVPGASGCFLGGVVAYSNDVKISLLNVPERTLMEKGAVSRETASAMAVGCRELFGSTISLSVTGIAGPDGGTEEKPIGTVYISIVGPEMDPITEGFYLGNLDRRSFKEEVSDRALGMILGFI
ncbi:MAG: CinA family protein [Thermoplasmata archaeon]|nr:CinA family protein [Thermoplasmata archaeon]